MSTHNTRRRSAQPIVAAVVQPVAKRLSRMEALLIEMRYEQDIQLKRSTALQDRLDTLTELVAQRSNRRGARKDDHSHRRPMRDSLSPTETPPVNGGKPSDTRLH
jgi:hypothetical protein